ncbi:MAG: flagellar type III secretion system pore protein FliP [Verrucomicrobiota bacterium]
MKKILLTGLLLFALAAFSNLYAQANDLVQISINTGKGSGAQLSTSLQILLLFTVLSVAPSILLMTTCFVRMLIVFSFLRSAITIQQPSNQVVIALALFLTAFIMAPTWQAINRDAVDPLRAGTINAEEAFNRATVPLKAFMLRQMREKDLELFVSLSSEKIQAEKPADLPIYVIIPSFMLAELRTGFQMGLLILLPFLVVDMVVASTLMSLGMMMLPPPIVSLPIKIMVFVLVDGWTLIVRSMINSFL